MVPASLRHLLGRHPASGRNIAVAVGIAAAVVVDVFAVGLSPPLCKRCAGIVLVEVPHGKLSAGVVFVMVLLAVLWVAVIVDAVL